MSKFKMGDEVKVGDYEHVYTLRYVDNHGDFVLRGGPFDGRCFNPDGKHYKGLLPDLQLLTPKYIPGQRLNSAAEVMQALLDGQVLSSVRYGLSIQFSLVNGNICDQFGGRRDPCLICPEEWTIYTPTKRKVKSERWFAVLPSKPYPDGFHWCGDFLTEAAARKAYGPNALAYVRAECEVEVDE